MIFKTTREEALQDLENYINKDILDYFTKNLTQTSYEVLIINDYSDDI